MRCCLSWPALVLVAVAAAGPIAKAQTPIVKVDGSSTVYPVTEAVAEEFQNSKRGVARVTVGISGTGGGFKKFVRGEIDIADASRPILKDEMAAARKGGIQYIELPICFDALTVAVNPQATWLNEISIEDLKKMWEPSARGKIMKWNQIHPNWPDKKLELFGAGADSGTFDYFTEAVVGKAKSCRGDYTGSEDDNVLVQGIAGNKYALGFLPYSYYAANPDKLKALGISWQKKNHKAVKPSPQAVVTGEYMPLSRPLFIYVNLKSANEKPAVREFVEFYLNNVKALAAEVKYLPLPEKAYKMGHERFSKRHIGTGFGGVPEVGLHVEDILKREPKS